MPHQIEHPSSEANMDSESFHKDSFSSIARTTALEDTFTAIELQPWKGTDARNIHLPNSMEADVGHNPRRFSPLNTDDDEKSESDASPDPDPRYIRSKFLSPYAWSIVLGELCVILFVTGFIIVTNLCQVPLPPSVAQWAKDSPNMKAFCVTAISTSLSVLCSFNVAAFLCSGFSNAVLLYTTATLTRSPTSLFELSAVIDVSRASFVFRKSHLTISIMTVASTIVLKSMTASFATLLTPSPIMLRQGMSGQEIDLSKAEFGKMLHKEIGWDDEERTQPQGSAVFGYIAGYGSMPAAPSHTRYPSMFTFNGATYSIPTGGILAVGPMHSVIHNPRKDGHLVGDDTAVEMKKYYHVDGIADDTVFSTSINYTTHQIGLRGGVSCKAIGSSGLASSCARIQLKLVKHWKSPSPRNQSFSDWVLSGACPNGTQIDVPMTTFRYIPGLRNKTVEIMGQAGAHVCFDQDLTGAKSTGNHGITIPFLEANCV
ncbi:uncharacterized protein MELLADRAFT_84902 [Melampsora larici-populina 98AG31]|uniref:Uncharacterized protein n=1 Tax=Melampsora larici-populina (strain 98AG31 / pathotype 3-4-7) TaxID=747676 RepID=F4RH68_MELLP|nr:uncharacterized protein MELLADRAFT_84902 [Melampsora larici-populina 98AG31]EGG08382.1 hypothetical protein MELLADRAFT_84902 [Melampsora larici-populina 98AG31]